MCSMFVKPDNIKWLLDVAASFTDLSNCDLSDWPPSRLDLAYKHT